MGDNQLATIEKWLFRQNLATLLLTTLLIYVNSKLYSLWQRKSVLLKSDAKLGFLLAVSLTNIWAWVPLLLGLAFQGNAILYDDVNKNDPQLPAYDWDFLRAQYVCLVCFFSGVVAICVTWFTIRNWLGPSSNVHTQ